MEQEHWKQVNAEDDRTTTPSLEAALQLADVLPPNGLNTAWLAVEDDPPMAAVMR